MQCAQQSDLAQVRQRPRLLAFLSVPIDTPPSLGSLVGNQLCGLNYLGNGTYTTEGITKLCEALKGSAVTSLKCAASPERLLLCQRPLTRTCPLTVPPHPSLAESGLTTSQTRVPPRWLPSSRRRRSPRSGASPPDSVRLSVNAH